MEPARPRRKELSRIMPINPAITSFFMVFHCCLSSPVRVAG